MCSNKISSVLINKYLIVWHRGVLWPISIYLSCALTAWIKTLQF